jgi:GT2 family glycosyltransferase
MCLRAFYKALSNISDFAFDVFLVDDGSTDGTGLAVKTEFPEVHVIAGNGQLYWNRGMHLAWQSAVAKGKYNFFLWLNDDTLLFPNALQTILKSSKLKDDTALICGTTQSAISNEITYGGKKFDKTRVLPKADIERCDLINGNCLLVPYSVFEKVGMLDPIFPHASGDFDYGLRAKQKGINSFVASKCIGTCEADNGWPKWCLPNYSIYQRIRNLYSPLGSSHPYYFFIFEKRHYGIVHAIKHFLSIHIRLLFPKLWL